MVPVEQANAFALREYLHKKVLQAASGDPFKTCLLVSLDLAEPAHVDVSFSSLSLYQKCAVSGLKVIEETVSEADLARLLGQSSRIDGTPMPWVSDVIGVMAVKSLVEDGYNDDMKERLESWIAGFVPQQITAGRLGAFELDIARYLVDSENAIFSTAMFPLYLHYSGRRALVDQKARYELVGKFMTEFVEHGPGDTSVLFLALMLFCFHHASKEIALVPPEGWSLEDLVVFLNRIPVGLKRWTWEEKGRTRGANPVKWLIENEYHVQNLLYVLLAPIFDDIADEINLEQLGQKNPRADLYLPGVHTIIEVKYRKNTSKSFANLIGEVAEDASLYHADPKYKDAKIVCFLWDHTRSTQEHAKLQEGVLKIQGIDACVVINAPSFM